LAVVTDSTGRPGSNSQTPERRIRRAWWIFAGSFFILGLIAVLRVLTDAAKPMDWAVVALVFVVGAAAILHREAVAAQQVSRREEAESFARILSSLSRSVAPDSTTRLPIADLEDPVGGEPYPDRDPVAVPIMAGGRQPVPAGGLRSRLD